jgi:uncharacterized OsmC-like protein
MSLEVVLKDERDLDMRSEAGGNLLVDSEANKGADFSGPLPDKATPMALGACCCCELLRPGLP